MCGEWDGTGEYQGNTSNANACYNSDYAQQVFAMVNQERADNGVVCFNMGQQYGVIL